MTRDLLKQQIQRHMCRIQDVMDWLVQNNVPFKYDGGPLGSHGLKIKTRGFDMFTECYTKQLTGNLVFWKDQTEIPIETIYCQFWKIDQDSITD